MGECMMIRRSGVYLRKDLPLDVTTQRSHGNVAFWVNEVTDATYQWYVNGVAVEGATKPLMLLPTFAYSPDTYQVYCVVTTAKGATQSRTAKLTINNSMLYYYGISEGAWQDEWTGGWQLTKSITNSSYSIGQLSDVSVTSPDGGNGKLKRLDVKPNNQCGFAHFANKIDLTYYSKIRFYARHYAQSTGITWQCVASPVNEGNITSVATYTGLQYGTSANWATVEIDVSQLIGSYYVGVCCKAETVPCYVEIAEIELIP